MILTVESAIADFPHIQRNNIQQIITSLTKRIPISADRPTTRHCRRSTGYHTFRKAHQSSYFKNHTLRKDEHPPFKAKRDLKNALTEENNAHIICECTSFIVTLHKNSKIVQ